MILFKNGSCVQASTITNLLTSEKGLQQAFYKHLGSYLTSRVRQLTAMVGESIAAKHVNLPLDEVQKK